MKSIIDFAWNGRTALREVVSQSAYGSVEQAVASLSAFTHPKTLEQLAGQNMFPVIRGKSNAERGKLHLREDGSYLMLDDNLAPIDAFLWANGLSRSRLKDMQFNHIWSDSRNVQLFTNLANICLLPAFLSKLSDTDEVVRNIIRYRAYELYGAITTSLPNISKPQGYESLQWAPTMPEQSAVESLIRKAMSTKSMSRTVICAKTIGWAFSKNSSGHYIPDNRL